MICRVEIEGIDRTGKDTLVGFIDYMSNRSIPVGSRGLLSTLAYADIYNRILPYSDDLWEIIQGNKSTLIVYLTADDDDLYIRYKTTNERMLDIQEHKRVFEKWCDYLEDTGLHVLKFNTSKMTPYQISKEVMDYINKINY